MTLWAGRLEGGLALYGSDWNSPGFLTIADFDAEHMNGVADVSDGGDTSKATVVVQVPTLLPFVDTDWTVTKSATMPNDDPEAGG